MPCPECDSPYLVSQKYENLRCPKCLNIGIVSPERVKTEVEDARDFMGENQVLDYLKDYDKTQLILALLRMGNKAVHEVWNNRAIPIRDFAFTPLFIKLLLPETGFGNKTLDVQDWPPETLETIIKHRFLVLRELNHLEEQFTYAYPKVATGSLNTIFDRYDLYQSEFSYCFDRCLKSLLGGELEHREQFDTADEELRKFETPDGDNIQSVRDFADAFYDFIIGMGFLLSSDESLNEVFYNEFPESVTILDIRDFMDALNNQFLPGNINAITGEEELAVVDWAEIQQIGFEIFDDDWTEVRDEIVMTPSNTDAHPFLFSMPVEEKTIESRLNRPSQLALPRVFYAQEYAQFIRFQMFPMLHDESGRVGHEVLTEVTEDRSEVYERNIHTYLQNEGYESYHSLKHYKSDEHELDVLTIASDRNELWFIECKYLLPKLRMDTAEGIRTFNEKMTEAVFEDGEPFDEKVDWWLENKSGENFTNQTGPNPDEDRTAARFKQSWTDLTVRRFVVSNLVPSYTLKRGVVFLTDMEFLEFLETGTLPFLPK